MELSDRLAYETDIINRVLQHDIVLYGRMTDTWSLEFRWQLGAVTVGPQFDQRELAIDWIAQWLSNGDSPSLSVADRFSWMRPAL